MFGIDWRLILGFMAGSIICIVLFDTLWMLWLRRKHKMKLVSEDHDEPSNEELGLSSVRTAQNKTPEKVREEPTILAQTDPQKIGAPKTINVKNIQPIKKPTEPPQKPLKQNKIKQDIIIMYIVSKKTKQLPGEALIQAILTENLTYADMGIFERYSDTSPKKAIFSIANADESGTFDIEQINKQKIRGLIVFQSMAGLGEPIKNFEAMLQTAANIAQQFGADLLDEDRNKFTLQTAMKYRKIIRELNEKEEISMTEMAA